MYYIVFYTLLVNLPHNLTLIEAPIGDIRWLASNQSSTYYHPSFDRQQGADTSYAFSGSLCV